MRIPGKLIEFLAYTQVAEREVSAVIPTMDRGSWWLKALNE